MQGHIHFLQSLLFTRKLLMYSLGRSSGLFFFMHPSQIASVDILHGLLLAMNSQLRE